MTRIVALDSGSDWCSVAAWEPAGCVWRGECVPRRHGERLLPMLASLLAECGWATTSVDAVAVGRGPGAFTGIRLGFAAAQGLAFSIDVPLVPVSNLLASALRGLPPPATAGEACWSDEAGVGAAFRCAPQRDRTVLVAQDARMGEVYRGAWCWAATRAGDTATRSGFTATEVLVERVQAPQALRLDLAALGTRHDPIAGFGDAVKAYPELDDAATDGPLVAWHGAAPSHARELAMLAADALMAGGGVSALQAEPVYLRDKVAQTLYERRDATSRANASNVSNAATRHPIDGESR